MSERASLEEVLEFANKVREAGGGNPLDALMPAIPEDPSACLIAKNLNFKCRVETDEADQWIMVVDSPELAGKIASTLGLDFYTQTVWEYEGRFYHTRHGGYVETKVERPVIVLPERIGQVASDFDEWGNALWYDHISGEYRIDESSEEEIRNLKDFWPYIEESVRETLNIAEVNEKGELIL
jgi:hypothetical protein